MGRMRETFNAWSRRQGPRIAAAAVGAMADVIEAGIQRRAPVGATGELRSEVDEKPTRQRGRRVTGRVVAESDHAAAQEFGTVHNPAQPFIRPTIDADSDDAFRAAQAAARREV